MNLKQSLKKKLTKQELSILPRAFDAVGNIAIVRLPTELGKKAKLIGTELLKLKHIQTVVNKIGEVKGKLRKASYKIITGKKTLETTHKESGCRFKFDISKTYFSPRLASDRLDIADQVRKNEKILVMFAGIAPYAIVIAKNTKAKEIVAIELNKHAIKYAKENLKLNKIKNITLIQGDVKKVVPSLKRKGMKFDRIVMTRPQLRETFLREAFSVSEKGAIVHFHDFLRGEEIPFVSEGKIKEMAYKTKRKIKLLNWKKIGEIAPYKYRVRIDFKIL